MNLAGPDDASSHPALSRDLLTYLGNKRSLLALISAGVAMCPPAGVAPGTAPRLFVDAFTGSGVVARWARLQGFRVLAIDLEEYARPFGTAFLTVSPDDVDRHFREPARALGVTPEPGAYAAVLAALDSLTAPVRPESLYFAHHYAPRKTEVPDLERERLFFTRENATKIDAIIERLHEPDLFTPVARDIVLASLLAQMSVHINTSGVMKGFHRGWGGRGRDALSRILAPISLRPLPLIPGPPGRIEVGDAAAVISRHRTETDRGVAAITYADPPYTIHQYGANYHLLTSAVRNDRYDPGPVRRGSRAGIRRDHRRSLFASRRGAEGATRTFLEAVSTRHLLYSYNNGGILAPERVLELLSNGLSQRVRIVSTRHTRFRGGKGTQAGTATEEFLFVVDRSARQSAEEYESVRQRLRHIAESRDLHDSYVDPDAFARAAPDTSSERTGGGWTLRFAGAEVARLRRDLRVERILDADPSAIALARSSAVSKRRLFDIYLEFGEIDLAFKVMRSFKVRKYHEDFETAAKRLAPYLDERRLTELGDFYERILERPAPFHHSPVR